MFIERTIDDFSHSQSNDILYWRFYCSPLSISIVINSSSFWYLYLTSVSTLSFFSVSVAIFNHIRASIMTLLNWL